VGIVVTNTIAYRKRRTTATRNSEEKRKCHGNQKVQHFKQKCRARGLNQEEIITLIHQRNDTINERPLNDQTIHEQPHEPNKRKRDLSTQHSIQNSIKSMSQLSISQGVSKKMKNSTQETKSLNDSNSNQSEQVNYIVYKPSKYLRMPRKLLLHSLRLQLNSPLKKKKEQSFILSRLELVDQQFCLDQTHYLYQTYCDLGLQHQIWLVSLKFILYTYKIIFFFISRMIFSK
jgi:DNA-binding transcriptional regulator YhcF (GntR family)